ncbi:MAG: potassium channel family protein [Nodosilinea sp.]
MAIADQGQISQPQSEAFLVCGLGSLGQHCVANLKTFGVPVYAIDQHQPDAWEVPALPDLLDRLVIADCRLAAVLEQAGVRHCRAVLLLTQDGRVNLEAALTARVLNPQVRLVMRSDKQNLNQLLAQQLSDFTAFEPSQLAAPAFALEAFGDHLLGYFHVEGHRFQVIKQRLPADHVWCDRRQLHELDTRYRRVLCHHPGGAQARFAAIREAGLFYTWRWNTPLRAGDEVVTIESDSPSPTVFNVTPTLESAAKSAPGLRRRLGRRLQRLGRWSTLKADMLDFWRSGENQLRQVALVCGLTIVVLSLMGTVLLDLNSPAGMSGFEAFLLSFITLFGGYGDVFETLADFNNPRLLQGFGLLLTLAGTAFVGVLYALLTEKLLALRFEFMERRPPVPDQGHVVVIWLGQVGRQVISLLQELKQPVVAIAPQRFDTEVLPQVPLLTGDVATALDRANLATAKSVVAVSTDEVDNLEIGLLAHRLNPHCRAIIRTYNQQFSDRIAQLFPFAQVLCAAAISAEAFAAAAFGENVVGLLRLYDQTVLATQYTVEPGDTLEGLLLSQVAYGYGVVPVWHQRPPQAGQVMPSEDTVLRVGDRLVVLATISGLRCIEQRQLANPTCTVAVDHAINPTALFDGAAEIARTSGLPLAAARDCMVQLPCTLPQPLYPQQAHRLVRLLAQSQISARVVDYGPASQAVGQWTTAD